MKFKKYVKESLSPSMTLDESMFDMDTWNPDRPSYVKDEIDKVFDPIQKLIADGNFDEAAKELADLESEIEELESTNAKKKFFKYPKFMLDGQRKRIDMLKSKLPSNESIEDMDRRCEKCNTLLNDGGTCPKCDDGEEDYGDNLREEMSNKEKLLRAYPELNFENSSIDLAEEIQTEGISNKEKLLRAYPELNFGSSVVSEDFSNDTLSVREKLKAAYPELNFDAYTESLDPSETPEEDEWYDDDYDSLDDVEEDRAHAALYGGDRMYCDCGAKLAYDEYGSYCPECDPKDPDYVYESYYYDACEYSAKECSYEMSNKIATMAKTELRLPPHEVEMLEHDINNLRSNEWADSFASLPDNSKVKKLFFEYAVECTAEE